MMPVYFHLQSHLWIAYLFLVNGFLLHLVWRNYSNNYAAMTQSLEASVLAAFFISLTLNGVLMLSIDLLGQRFSVLGALLPIVTFVFLLIVWVKVGWRDIKLSLKIEVGWARLCLYILVFVILFYNGGLIEQVSDAWYHMSLANKIGLESSFTLSLGHLTGTPTRYYPPLWHANLALAHTISDISIPIFWNSITAWVGVFKVMSFYLLAYALCKKKEVAILSALLFCLLPGLGDSYLRVSAWPSHIAYTAMFVQFYVGFWLADQCNAKGNSFLPALLENLLQQKSALLLLAVLSTLIVFTHQLELLWFYSGVTIYLAGLTIYRLFGYESSKLLDLENDLLHILAYVVFSVGLVLSVFGLYDNWSSVNNDLDRLAVGFFFLILFLFLLCLTYIKIPQSDYSKILVWVALATIVILAITSIDYRHVVSLVLPDMAYSRSGAYEAPHFVAGLLGGELKLPGWHHQLRLALLYSGLISLPISMVLVLLQPSRASIFLSSNALIAMLFIVSPYFYQWLTSTMNYHSSWRISVLVFHPIIIAMAFYIAWDKLNSGFRE